VRIRRATLLKAFGASAAALLAAAPLASALHVVAVPHEVCADHGELVHGDHVSTSSAPDETASLGTETQADSHEHDHCLLGTPAAGASLRPSRVVAASTVAVTDGGFSLRRSAPIASEALYRIAPKTSPPA